MAESIEPRTEAPPALAQADATSRPTNRWKGMFKRLLLLYLLWLLLGCAIQRKLIYPIHFTEPIENAGGGVAGLEKIWLDTPQGRVEGWFVPGEGVSAERPGPVVFFTHGNADLIDYCLSSVQRYTRMGINIAMLEYRGYGRSAGTPSQAKLVDDAIRFHDLITAKPQVDPARVVFHGQSLGGGVACAVARQRRPAALILQSPFTSIKAMAGRYGIPPFLVWDKYDNAAFLKTYDSPILILHGEHDNVIPFRHGKSLAAIAPHATFIPYDCSHNDFPMNSKEYWADIDSFLRSANLLSAAE